jgi:hypothetical protein
LQRRKSEPDRLHPATFEEEESVDIRRQFVRQAIRLTLAFVALFCGVYFAFWWSGSAVRFGTARVTDRAVPTWQVVGIVRDEIDKRPIPWARVEDDPAGQPPFFHADADLFGAFELFTLPERHRLRISAPGYRPATVDVSRAWFLWMPHGKERVEVTLMRK